MIKKPIVGETLNRLQALIAEDTGSPVRPETQRRIESILKQSFENNHKPKYDSAFSTREVTILMGDLRGFTSITEAHPVGMVLDLLNRYLVKMTEIIIRHHGTIDKFMGDSIMVLFGSTPGTMEDDVIHAVQCAVEMQIAMDGLNSYHRSVGAPEFFMGIGINTGTVMAGTLGSDLYSEYTVIGDQVNLVSRIEAFSLRGQVLISENTYVRCKELVETGDPIDVYVKGKVHPVSMREVLGIPSRNLEVPRQELRRSPRIEVNIPFKFCLVENKIVMPEVHNGTILDIGYHGVLAEVDKELDPYSEIKLELDLSLIGYLATDIYAKILRTRRGYDRYLSNMEFTSISVQSTGHIKNFIHLLIQGSEIR